MAGMQQSQHCVSSTNGLLIRGVEGQTKAAMTCAAGRFDAHWSVQGQPEFSDVATASWVGEGSGLEALAQPLRDLIPDEALVAGSVLREELSRLLLRCRSRESLIDGLGASALARYRPGVRALFTGQSGTGKTLAAGWLATQLG